MNCLGKDVVVSRSIEIESIKILTFHSRYTFSRLNTRKAIESANFHRWEKRDFYRRSIDISMPEWLTPILLDTRSRIAAFNTRSSAIKHSIGWRSAIETWMACRIRERKRMRSRRSREHIVISRGFKSGLKAVRRRSQREGHANAPRYLRPCRNLRGFSSIIACPYYWPTRGVTHFKLYTISSSFSSFLFFLFVGFFLFFQSFYTKMKYVGRS